MLKLITEVLIQAGWTTADIASWARGKVWDMPDDTMTGGPTWLDAEPIAAGEFKEQSVADCFIFRGSSRTLGALNDLDALALISKASCKSEGRWPVARAGLEIGLRILYLSPACDQAYLIDLDSNTSQRAVGDFSAIRRSIQTDDLNGNYGLVVLTADLTALSQYRNRYSHLLMHCGMILQNFYLLAPLNGLGCCALGGIDPGWLLDGLAGDDPTATFMAVGLPLAAIAIGNKDSHADYILRSPGLGV